jgi:hypothetical protein
MSAYVKIAVTVPAETFAAVERVRRRMGKTRSAAVSLALEEWLRSVDLSDADRRYIEGYRRQPEAVDEIAAVAAQATASWTGWEPEVSWAAWEPGQPSRAAEPRRPSRAAEPRRPPPAARPRRARTRRSRR